MSKYLRVRPLDLLERQQQGSSIDILDLFSIAMKPDGSENQVKNLQAKDTYQFSKIFGPSDQNSDVYSELIQKTVNEYFQMKSYRILIKGEEKSGRNYTLIGKTQDPGLLFLFGSRLFDKLHILKQREEPAQYEYQYKYKCYLKCYQRQKNNNYDLLSGVSQAMVNNESVVSVDTYFDYLRLLKLIMKNAGMQHFKDVKAYHVCQQQLTKYHLNQVTFDFILERTAISWYGTEETSCAHYKFDVESLLTESPVYPEDMIIYLVNPSGKAVGQTKVLLKMSGNIKITKPIKLDHYSIIKNKFNFILNSIKLITVAEIKQSTRLLFKQFRNELEKYMAIAELKQRIVEDLQDIISIDSDLIGKVITSVDSREFLMAKLSLYQIVELEDTCKDERIAVNNSIIQLRKLLQSNISLQATNQTEHMENRIFQDIKRNATDIINILKQLVQQEQYRSFNYKKISNYIKDDLIQQIREHQSSTLTSLEGSRYNLPNLNVRNGRKATIVKQQINDNELGMLLHDICSQRTEQSSTIQNTFRTNTDTTQNQTMTHRSKHQTKSELLKKPITLNTDEWTTPQIQFNKATDYKILNHLFQHEPIKIIDNLSMLKQPILQNRLISPKSLIRNTQKQAEIEKELNIYRIPQRSDYYIRGIERMISLQLFPKDNPIKL